MIDPTFDSGVADNAPRFEEVPLPLQVETPSNGLPIDPFADLLRLSEHGPYEKPDEMPRDNTDPHTVTLIVHPRQTVIPFVEWEAEYEFEIDHPDTCSACVEDCPVADYLENVGIDETFYEPFPQPDFLDEATLAALDGTVLSFVMTRHFSSWSTPDGTEYDCDWDTIWLDLAERVTPDGIPTKGHGVEHGTVIRFGQPTPARRYYSEGYLVATTVVHNEREITARPGIAATFKPTTTEQSGASA